MPSPASLSPSRATPFPAENPPCTPRAESYPSSMNTSPLREDGSGEPTTSQFVQTRWSVVLGAKSGSFDSLDLLCRWYREPLRRHIQRRGFREADAEDLIQDFLGRKLVEGALFKSVQDPQVTGQKRRFRTFLLTCLDHFLHDKRRRRPDPSDLQAAVALDAEPEEGHRPVEIEAPPLTNEEAAAAREDWAETVLKLAEDRHRAEFVAAGKSANIFTALNAYYNDAESSLSGAELARLMNVKENNFHVIKHRFGARRSHWLREVVKETLENPDDWESEVRELLGGDV